jgi:hypothetical protein
MYMSDRSKYGKISRRFNVAEVDSIRKMVKVRRIVHPSTYMCNVAKGLAELVQSGHALGARLKKSLRQPKPAITQRGYPLPFLIDSAR